MVNLYGIIYIITMNKTPSFYMRFATAAAMYDFHVSTHITLSPFEHWTAWKRWLHALRDLLMQKQLQQRAPSSIVTYFSITARFSMCNGNLWALSNTIIVRITRTLIFVWIFRGGIPLKRDTAHPFSPSYTNTNIELSQVFGCLNPVGRYL